MPDTKERRAEVLDFNSRVTVKMVIEIVVFAVFLSVGVVTIKYQITDVERTMSEIQKQLDELNAHDWKPINDYLFMEAYSKLNKLEMPTHSGADINAKR